MMANLISTLRTLLRPWRAAALRLSPLAIAGALMLATLGAAACAPVQPTAAQQQVLSGAGTWSGYWIVTTAGDRQHEVLDVTWTFRPNGDFADSGGGVVGKWKQTGANFEFNFTGSTVFKGTITNNNRMTGVFYLPQGGGVSGDFALTRK